MQITKEHIDLAISTAKKFGVTKLILFGSGLTTPDMANDLDLACEGLNDWRFFEFGAELEQALKIPVDIVPLNPKSSFTEYIVKQGKSLYEI